jgi:3-phenylpropionate/cinnamic acid dioxygenase small subunit
VLTKTNHEVGDTGGPGDLQRFLLRLEIEEFLFQEADLLDRRCFREWLDLLTDDIAYFMPIRRNVKFGEHDKKENTIEGVGISWFDEDKWTLTKRVEQLMTGVHYAEEPLSRVCHLVTNVQILETAEEPASPSEVTVRSRFLIYQNRMEDENYTFIGKRTDRLRREGRDWRIARREILLDQSVLLAKNLTVFF